MTKREFLTDIKAIKRDYRAGKLTQAEAVKAIKLEIKLFEGKR